MAVSHRFTNWLIVLVRSLIPVSHLLTRAVVRRHSARHSALGTRACASPRPRLPDRRPRTHSTFLETRAIGGAAVDALSVSIERCEHRGLLIAS